LHAAIALCVIALTVLSSTGTLRADAASDLEACADAEDHNNHDAAIGFCSRALQSGDLSDEDKALALTDRGNAHDGKGDHARAIQDYDQALQLRPDYASAFYNRGLTYWRKGDSERAIQDFDQAIHLEPEPLLATLAYNSRGYVLMGNGDYDRAIQDFDQAIRLQPDYALAFNNRGLAYAHKGDRDRAFQNLDQALRLQPDREDEIAARKGRILVWIGRFAEAADAFTLSIQSNPQDAYRRLWLYFARERANQDGTGAFAASLGDIDLASWPSPIIRYYQGEVSEQAVLDSATDPDPQTANARACEAAFYIGEHDLLAGHTTDARRRFQNAIEICLKDSVEFHSARAELDRL
jgi:lipoprotein NlpI